MPDEQYEEQDQARETRAGAWLLLFVGLLGLGFGLYRWRGTILNSFQINTSYKTPDQIEAERIESLKTKDTAGSGLSDYDKIYVFHLSPYLKSSSGDGMDDLTKIMLGMNPNCPQGKSCGPLGSVAAAAAVTDASATQGASQNAQVPMDQAVQQFLHPTPDQVRKFLIDSGAKPEDLKNIDDATLLQMYQQSLQEAQTNAAAKQAAPGSTSN